MNDEVGTGTYTTNLPDPQSRLSAHIKASAGLPFGKLMNKDQARTNVVNEIVHAEREYVKNLRDVIEVNYIYIYISMH